MNPGPAAPAERRGLFALLKRDLQRYFELDGKGPETTVLAKLRIVLETPGIHAMLVYRFGSWVDGSVRSSLLRAPLGLAYHVLDKLSIICWGIHIDKRARIGGGLYIGHYGGVIIGPVRMGEDCNIGQQVAMGVRADGVPGTPTIGSRVWIGAGSILFGPIRVGDGVTIGPLSLISRNLPPGVLVVGNPMRLLRENYDNSAEIYGRKPARKAVDPS